MTRHDHTPVVIGVGDFVNRSIKVEDALEPAEMMLRAIKLALEDSGLSDRDLAHLQNSIDSMNVVATWTWPYNDLPGLLSDRLNITPAHKLYSGQGGHSPAELFDGAARQIAQGRSRVAVVTGEEALASLKACLAANKMPPSSWTKPSKDVRDVYSPTTRKQAGNLGALHAVGAPIQVYPMYENALRAERDQTPADNSAESSELYGSFAKVAESNAYSWNRTAAKSAAAIGSISTKNRMICSPYPLLMNAFNTVNLAGACILTSVFNAEQLGIEESRWIYPLGGAGAADTEKFWERASFSSSPSLSSALNDALQVCNLKEADVDFYDFYSCFPIVPKLACRHLGLSITTPGKPITLLGGLTSFGGAGNNYSLHAINASVRSLRAGRGQVGVVLANGGNLTHHHVVCLSSRTRGINSTYPKNAALTKAIPTDLPQIALNPEGEARIETYTVEYGRDGEPSKAHVVGRLLGDNKRFLANHADSKTLQSLANNDSEQVGRHGWVTQDPDHRGRNIFSIDAARL